MIAIWLPNCPELLCIYLACLKTGVVPMPLHHGMKWPEAGAIVAKSRPARLITSSHLARLHGNSLPSLAPEDIYVVNWNPSLAPSQDFDELMREGGGCISATLPSDGLALVLHTSGSDGRAKGVMLSRANMDHILAYRLRHTNLTSGSTSIVASCLTQSVGLYQSLALLRAGGTLVLMESYDVNRMAELINRHQPTHLIMVVDAFDKILHHSDITSRSLERLAFAAVGADRVTARVQERFMALVGRPLRVSYGLTESSWALVNSGDDPGKCLALGKPCPGIEIRLVGRNGRDVPVGEVGEIFIRSPRTMIGYLNDDERTREALIDGWLRSGDLARRDPQGYYWFAGREKNIIVLRTGDTVSPVEVEEIILRHPAVSHCVVTGVPAEDESVVPWAAVVRSDEGLTAGALQAFVRERLSDYKVPRRVVFLKELPVGLTGKVLASVVTGGESAEV